MAGNGEVGVEQSACLLFLVVSSPVALFLSRGWASRDLVVYQGTELGPVGH